MTHPQYGKPETWPHRIREDVNEAAVYTVERRGKRWWAVVRYGWIGWECGPYWRRSTAEKVRRRLAEEDRP